MRYHGLITPPPNSDDADPPAEGALNPQWRQLQRVREAITDLSEVKLPYNDIGKVAYMLYGKYRHSGDLPTRQAMIHTASMTNTHRFNFVQEILGMKYLRELTIDPWSIDGVIAALKANGPFYTSVNQGPRGVSLKPDPYLGGESYRIQQFAGGRHAMVVFAAYFDPTMDARSTDRERVYLWDPNDPRTVYYAAWEDLKTQLNTPTPFRGATIGVGISCDQPNACVHITQGVDIA
jgi:hypothetical protein